MHKMTRLTSGLMAAFGGVLFVVAHPALAQLQPQRVEITGSNIKRVDEETASPVTIIRREEIKRSGANSVKEFLDQLTSASPTLSDISGSNSFASGASSANLRNLGKTSTLILLNGRRVSAYALADFNEVFTNLDSLPFDAVQRIEVLRNGASAIYGSDAVAGVINVITRKNYEGVTIGGSHEQSLVSNKYKQRTASVTAGFGDLSASGFNVLANIEVFKRDAVMSREVLGYINPVRLRAGAIPTTFVAQASTFAYPGNNNLAPIQGCPTNLVIGGLCRYDRFERFELVPQADRTNGLLSGTFKLGSNLEAFAELILSRTETKYESPYQPYGQQIGPTTWGNPNNNSSQTFIPRGLPASHPLNTSGLEEPDFRYRFIDSPAGSTTKSTSYRGQFGLRGTVGALDWETGLGLLGSKVDDVQYGNFSDSGFKSLIGDYNAETLDRDFFNKPNGYRIGQANSPEVTRRLFPEFGTVGKTTQVVIDGKVSGELGRLGAGPIGIATGFDLRREEFTITPSANLAAGDIVGFGVSRTDGKRTFGSLYGEVSVSPIKGLEFQAAARVDKYPNISANVSPKLAAKWRASDLFMLRGTVESGFRAPNLTETAPSTKFAFNNGTVDPQRCNQAVALAGDLRTQAAALPASDPQKTVLDARADIVEQNECSAGVAAIVGNNPNLKPELSRSFSLGFALQPSAALSFTVDYWNIRRREEINLKTADELLAAEGNLPSGSRISRKPLNAADQTFSTAEQLQYGVSVGALDSITRGFENLFKTRTSGLDFGVQSNIQLPFGRVDLSGQAQYLIEYKAFNGGDNRFGDNLAGRYTYPRVYAVATASLTSGAWTNGFKFNHTSAYYLLGDYYETEGTADWCAARGLTEFCRVNAERTVDYFLRYTGFKNVALSLNIRNLFNRYTPVDFRDQFGTPIPQEANDAKRRTVRLAAEVSF